VSGLAEKHGQVSGRILGRHLEEHISDPAAVIGSMVHDVQQNRAARHRALITADEAEAYSLGQADCGLSGAALDPPTIHILLRGPWLGQFGVEHQVSRANAVIATFDMGLPHSINQIIAIQVPMMVLNRVGRSVSASPRGSAATAS
jgi:hypothetical protein